MIGQTLGHYRIDERIGAGGMGEVYKATDTRLDRTVAIKLLLAHVAADPDLCQRFEREACVTRLYGAARAARNVCPSHRHG